MSRFSRLVSLKTAWVLSAEPHPQADRLYIEPLDDGSPHRRTIVSGLVPYMSAEDLIGKTVVIAANLKPKPMRAVESAGMLLAGDDGGKEQVELIDCPWTAPGTPVLIEGEEPCTDYPDQIDTAEFFSLALSVKNGIVYAGSKPLITAGRRLSTRTVLNGEVG